MASYTTPQAAMRLARTIASDIMLYNKEKIAGGLRDDDLFARLKEDIAEGHRLFESRVDPEIRKQTNYLERALVDVLIGNSADVPTDIW